MRLARFIRPLLLAMAIIRFSGPIGLAAQELVEDVNGDGSITVAAFGDSITLGVGDGTQPGDLVDQVPGADGTAGYPARLSMLTGLVVKNQGVAGETAVDQGEERFPGAVTSSGADVIVIMEGTNDAVFRTGSSEVRRALQRQINVARALDRNVILATLAPPCCEHASLTPFVDAYNGSILDLASVNVLTVADVARAWRTTCSDLAQCELYNLPEGLHPNSVGYDAIAETVAAALFEVDLFSDSGADDFAGAFGVPLESVVVLPDSASNGG